MKKLKSINFFTLLYLSNILTFAYLTSLTNRRFVGDVTIAMIEALWVNKSKAKISNKPSVCKRCQSPHNQKT
ncbi:MAG: hypothetical protein EOO34_00165 [Cyanobacteriota bacterium]|nr:MAG: hypothetical protein EOO34_00165 [Cyanobacteriota bacterium]